MTHWWSSRWKPIGRNHAGSMFLIMAVTLLVMTGFLLTRGGNVTANPVEPPQPPPTDHPDGGPSPSSDSSLYFVSENVTVFLGEKASIIANYTFENPGNTSHNATILLPFHKFQGFPTMLAISMEDTPLDFTWDNYTFTGDLSHIQSPYRSARFSMHFEPFERLTIDVTYHRTYLSNEYGYGFEPEGSCHWHVGSFIYLARTGSLWDRPIEYAGFQFIIEKEVCTDTLLRDNAYSLYRTHWREHYDILKEYFMFMEFPYFVDQTDFLFEPISENETHILVSREYVNWTPEQDIGVVWDLQHFNRQFTVSHDSEKFDGNFTLNATGSLGIDADLDRIIWTIDGNVVSHGPITHQHFSMNTTHTLHLSSTCQFGNTYSSQKIIELRYTNEPVKYSIYDISDFGPEDKQHFQTVGWSIGVGPTVNEPVVTHTFDSPGIYRVSGRVVHYAPGEKNTQLHYRVDVFVFEKEEDEHDSGVGVSEVLACQVFLFIVVSISMVYMVRKSPRSR